MQHDKGTASNRAADRVADLFGDCFPRQKIPLLFDDQIDVISKMIRDVSVCAP